VPRVTEYHFRTNAKKSFRMLEDCFQQVQKYDICLNYPALDLDNLYIRGYTDASFGMNVDGSSYVGYCILLLDKFDRFAVITFRSGKCHRVMHSAMAAETCAFAEAFDAAFVLKHSLKKLLKRQIRLQMLTDSKQLFDAISHSTQTKEKRVLIDIEASKQSFEGYEISDLGLVAGRDMLADCFTKVMEATQRMSALESGLLRHEFSSGFFAMSRSSLRVCLRRKGDRRSVANEAFLGLTTISKRKKVGDLDVNNPKLATRN
jgi:hypothetical protein